MATQIEDLRSECERVARERDDLLDVLEEEQARREAGGIRGAVSDEEGEGAVPMSPSSR